MEAILTIEVPNGFKKGECERCPINAIKENALSCLHYLSNCPLEIGEDIHKVAEKTGFKINHDLFGRYCKIATSGYEEPHIYKIVTLFESNGWVEVPINFNSKMITHDHMEKVINVIHCGVDETEVIRVALKDVELL